mmetsp:Transcript_32551/g.69327  ORF Transcript_32551/g.69327 Transcript_32551/m.69327 type:complete len:499 (+) Transcript_32551:73-1569(+)
MNSSRRQVSPPGSGVLGTPADQAERDRNREMLRRVAEDHQKLRSEHEERTAQVHQMMAEQQRAFQQELGELRREKSELKNELVRTRNELQGEVSRERSEFQGEMGRMRQEFGALMRELQGTRRADQEQERKLQEHQREIRVLKEGHGSKQEFNELKQLHQQHQQELMRLKQGTHSTHELTSLKAQTDLTAMEFRDLKKQIYDRGLLAPKREIVEEEEDARPPVGTIELGEHVFTARLLVRLGFMKARNDRQQLALLDGRDEDETFNGDSFYALDTNVTGLEIPEVEEGGRGYCQITYGWCLICAATVALQGLVLLVMLRNGLTSMGNNSCFDAAPDPTTWWLLHLSKALAMIVAGILLGQDLMDTANYWMVSELIEQRMSFEVVVSACLRIGLTAIIIASNICIFMNLVNPAEVWMNMTALGFIHGLGSDVLETAKRGMFGHNIAKTMTTLNFQLTFLSEYPAWFTYVQGMVVTISTSVILVFASIVFITPDAMCDGL